MLKKQSLALAITAVSVSLGSAFTSAQATLEEIVVTAQKRSESLQEVPVAVSVTTAEQLARDQIYSLQDLQRTTPALEISQTFGGEQNGGGRLRGLGTVVSNNTASASVAMVIDQVPQGNIVFPQLFDLAQVEVLRGPQGTLFGQTASAGVINITTADADTSEFYSSVGFDVASEGTAGSEFDQNVFRGMVNIPVGERSALRLSAYYKGEEGVQRNVYLDRPNKIDTKAIRAKFNSQLSDTVSLELTADWNEQNDEGRNFFAIAKTPTNPGSTATYLAEPCGLSAIDEKAEEYCSPEMDDINREKSSISALIEWDIADYTITSVTNYRQSEQDLGIQEYSRLIPGGLASDQEELTEADQFSQEFRLTSNFDGPFNYITGVYYSDYNLEITPTSTDFGNPFNPVGFSVCVNAGPPGAVGPIGFCPVPVAFTTEESSISSMAIFGDATFDINEATQVFGGLRYTDVDVTSATGIDGPVTNVDEMNRDNIGGRLGVRYFANDDTMVYASYARGFKNQVIAVPDTPLLPTVRLEPEEPTAYELGAKISVNDSLDLDINVFYTEVENFQAQRSVFVGTSLVSVLENIESIKTKGFEFSARGVAGDSLSYTFGYIYADVPYPDDFVGADGGSLAGEQLVFAPKHKANLSGEYGIDLSNGMGLFLNANATYKTEVRLEARSQDDFLYPSHINVGASIGLRSADEKWQVQLFGRNLTAERAPAAYLASTFFGAIDGGVRAWPEAGVSRRQVGISADFNF